MINLLFKLALFLFLSFLGFLGSLVFLVVGYVFGFGWLGFVLFWVLFVIIVASEWSVDGFAGYLERLNEYP